MYTSIYLTPPALFDYPFLSGPYAHFAAHKQTEPYAVPTPTRS
jgi:hypothetical protein